MRQVSLSFSATLVLSVFCFAVSDRILCEDNATYRDKFNMQCHDWRAYNCSYEANRDLGFSLQEIQDVQGNCAESCASCTPGPYMLASRGKVIHLDLQVDADLAAGTASAEETFKASLASALSLSEDSLAEFNLTNSSQASYRVAVLVVVNGSAKLLLERISAFGNATSDTSANLMTALSGYSVNIGGVSPVLNSRPMAEGVKVLRDSINGSIHGIYRQSVPVFSWCTDLDGYVDELGEDCNGWAGFDCSDIDMWVGSENEYSVREIFRVMKWCPLSCGLCEPPGRSPPQELLNTCADDALLAGLCASWRGLDCEMSSHMGYGEYYSALLLDRCPLSCGVCNATGGVPACGDNATFLDEQGQPCGTFTGDACTLPQAQYTRHGMIQVQAHCPRSCGFCTARRLQGGGGSNPGGFFGSYTQLAGSMFDQCQDDKDYSYSMLFTCRDFVGKYCTLGSMRLNPRWALGPSGMGIGPWGSWRWHRPLWSACPVSCGLCSPADRLTPAALLTECENDDYNDAFCTSLWGGGQDCSQWQSRIRLALPEEAERYNSTLLETCPLSCGFCTPPVCGAGTHRDRSNHICSGCELGAFAAGNRSGEAAASCQVTRPGQYVDMVNATWYQRCEPGFYNERNASTNCSACPPGRYSDSFALSECAICEPGTYQDAANQTACHGCPSGKYTPAHGSLACLECLANRTTFWQKASNITECACPEGTYQPDGRSLDVCKVCPGGMRCPGGHLYTDESADLTGYLLPGHMSLPDAPWVVYTCDLKNKTCPEERKIPKDMGELHSTVCSHGRTGVRCASCPPQWYSRKGKCRKCFEHGAFFTSVKVVITLFLQLGLTAWAYRAESKETTAAWMMFMAFVSFVQVLQSLSKIPLDWPPELSNFFNLLKLFSIPGFFAIFEMRLDCFFGASTISQVLRDAAVPTLPFINFMVLIPIALLVRRPMEKVLVLDVIAKVITGLFVTIAGMSVQLFPAEKMPDPNDMYFVRALPGVEYMSAEWYSLLPITLVAVVVYCGGTLVYTIRGCYLAPKKVTESEDFSNQYDFILGDMNPSAWWWIMVNLLYGFTLTIIQAIFTDVFLQLYLSMLLLTLIILLQLSVRPNIHGSVNNVEGIFLVANLIFLIFATSFIKEKDLHTQDPGLHATIMIGCLGVVLVYAMASIVAWVTAALRASQVGKSARVAFRGRDITTLLANMPEAEYLGRGGTMMEMDRQVIKKLTDMLVANFLGQQPAKHIGRLRIMPGAEEFKVWKPSQAASDALNQVHTRQAHSQLEDILATRMLVKVLVHEMRAARIGPLTMAKRVEQRRLVEASNAGGLRRLKAKLSVLPMISSVVYFARRFAAVFIDPKRAASFTLPEFLAEVDPISSLGEEMLKRIFRLLDHSGDGQVVIEDTFHILTSMAPVEGHELDEEESGWNEAGGKSRSPLEEENDATGDGEENFAGTGPLPMGNSGGSLVLNVNTASSSQESNVKISSEQTGQSRPSRRASAESDHLRTV